MHFVVKIVLYYMTNLQGFSGGFDGKDYFWKLIVWVDSQDRGRSWLFEGLKQRLNGFFFVELF